MAERDREGGCRRRGVAFSIPPRNGGAASAAAEGIAQQIEISAAHQGLSALHEPDCSIAEVMGFPAARGHAIRPEQGCGDGAIARPVLAGVKRAQGLDQAVATLGRQLAEVRARRPAGKGAPQAPCRVGAEFEEIVEWKLCRIARAETRRVASAMRDGRRFVSAAGCASRRMPRGLQRWRGRSGGRGERDRRSQQGREQGGRQPAQPMMTRTRLARWLKARDRPGKDSPQCRSGEGIS